MFKNKSVGLDISDRSIEITSLSKSGKKIKIDSFNRVEISKGIVENGNLKKEEELKKILTELLQKAKPKKINIEKLVFGIQDGLIYSENLFLKGFTKKDDIKPQVFDYIQKNIPLSSSNIVFSYKIITESDEGLDVLAIVTDKSKIIKWLEFLKSIGAKDVIFDPLALANVRGLTIKKNKKPICVIDLGAKTTGVSTFDRNGLQYSFQIQSAGNAITKEIADKLKIKPELAEKKKLEIGISKNKKDKKISDIIKNQLESIIHEIKEADEYYFGDKAKNITKTYLLGGTSLLKGLPTFFESIIKRPVLLGGKVIKENNLLLYPSNFKPQLFIGAIGLAMRDLDKEWDKTEPSIELTDYKKPMDTKLENTKGKAVKIQDEEKDNGSLLSKDRVVIEKKTIKSALDLDSKKKVILLIILLVGIALLVGAYFARNYSRKTSFNPDKQATTSAFQYPASFILTFPIAINTQEYTPDRIRGRVIDFDVESVDQYLTVLSNSRVEVGKQLVEGEIIWNKSLDQPSNINDLTYPTKIKWLVYYEKDANKLAIKKVKEKLGDVKFVLENINYNAIKVTENKDVYLLEVKVDVSATQVVDNVDEGLSTIQEVPAKVIEVVKKDTMTIKDTPTGFLNVRSGPSISNKKIDQIRPGDTFELLEQKDGWVKFQLDDSQVGWVTDKYVTINKVQVTQ